MARQAPAYRGASSIGLVCVGIALLLGAVSYTSLQWRWGNKTIGGLSVELNVGLRELKVIQSTPFSQNVETTKWGDLEGSRARDFATAGSHASTLLIVSFVFLALALVQHCLVIYNRTPARDLLRTPSFTLLAAVFLCTSQLVWVAEIPRSEFMVTVTEGITQRNEVVPLNFASSFWSVTAAAVFAVGAATLLLIARETTSPVQPQLGQPDAAPPVAFSPHVIRGIPMDENGPSPSDYCVGTPWTEDETEALSDRREDVRLEE